VYGTTLIYTWIESVLLLTDTVCVAEQQQMPNLKSLILTQPCLEPTIYHNRGEHNNPYTVNAVTVCCVITIQVYIKVVPYTSGKIWSLKVVPYTTGR
jgi:hypothetical protein